MAFNQTAHTLGNPGLFGVAQKLCRALGRNNVCSIVPRRDSGCLHQRKRAKNKHRPAPEGRPLTHLLGDHPEAVVLILCSQPGRSVGVCCICFLDRLPLSADGPAGCAGMESGHSSCRPRQVEHSFAVAFCEGPLTLAVVWVRFARIRHVRQQRRLSPLMSQSQELISLFFGPSPGGPPEAISCK
jgi:hypothetical protein